MVKATRKKQFNPASTIRQHRLALGRTAEDIARSANFSTSKILRIERAPERARLGDVLHLAETLERLERGAGGSSDLSSAVSLELEKRSELFPFGEIRGGR